MEPVLHFVLSSEASSRGGLIEGDVVDEDEESYTSCPDADIDTKHQEHTLGCDLVQQIRRRWQDVVLCRVVFHPTQTKKKKKKKKSDEKSLMKRRSLASVRWERAPERGERGKVFFLILGKGQDGDGVAWDMGHEFVPDLPAKM